MKKITLFILALFISLASMAQIGAITGTFNVCVGSTTTLSCTPPGGSWASSNPSFASVNPSSGVVTGVAAGVVTITYFAIGTFATASLTVNPTPTILCPSSGCKVCTGSSIILTGSPTAGVWTSGSLSLATVGSLSGVVTGVSPGTATINYTLSTGCTASASVLVNPSPGLITGTLVVCAGSSTTLNCTPSGGTWSNSPIAPGTITPGTGVFTGIAAGVSTVSYTNSFGCFATADVTVNPSPSISGLSTGINLALCVGNTLTLNATPAGGSWSSLNIPVATIGSVSGIVTGISPGVATMVYTILPGGCSASVSVTVNPNPGPITGTMSVCVGAGTTLTCPPGTGLWSSSPLTIASVGSSTGVVIGVSPGVATVTYTLATSCYATTTVTVNPQPVILGYTAFVQVCQGSSVTMTASITGGVWASGNTSIATIGSSSGVLTGITPGTTFISYTLLPGGCSVTLAVTVSPAAGPITGSTSVCTGATTTLNCTPSGGAWSSSPLTVGTITSGTGIFTGISAGVATVTYTLPTGCFATTTVTVNLSPRIFGGSTGLPPEICVGSSITLGATPTGGVWSSLNIPIATVGSSSGTVTGISPGVATIVYTTLPGGCFATITVTVDPNPGPITGPMSVCAGTTTTLNCTPSGGTWSSSPLTVGTITSGTGIFTGISAGVATVTYTLPTGCFITTAVTVNPVPVILGISTGALARVCVGASLTLTGSPAGGTWTSGNPAVATVGSSSGVITGISPGSATIVYTLPTGCSVSITVIVNPNPGPITGTTVVCVGGSTALACTPAGGAWSCSPLTVGTISGTGVFTGISGGVATVTYTSPAGCFVTALVTVNPLPVLTGPFITCVGSSVSLTGSPALGTWVSGTPAVATIGAISGIVTGITPGTTVITYTISTGCTATVVVTITPTPGPIACPSTGCQVCQTGTIVLTDPVPGGTWSSSNTGIATVGSASGIVTGISAGTSYITYTLGGCYVVNLITVDPIPGVYTVTGGGSYCAGGPGVAVGLSWSQLGVNYQLFCGLTPVGPSVPGTGLPISFGLQTAPCVYTVVAVNAFGCTATMIGSAAVTVNPMPLPIACPTSGCSGCVGMSVLLTDATTGGLWSSSNPGIATVVATSGVVTGVSAGVTVITYMLPGGCFVTTSFTVNPSPSPITGNNHVCVGNTIVLSNATPGGTWSSSCGNASVNSASGVVTGIAAGPCNSITYTLPGGCYVTYAITVNPSPCNVGVEEESVASGEVNLFPNPATNEITIQMDGTGYSSFAVTNIMGKVMLQQNISGEETTVNVRELAPAIYFITLRGEKGILVKRFVKE